YDAAGAPVGGEFPVNTYTTGTQGRSVIASDANGNFVVVWISINQDGSSHGLFGQVFTPAGARFGSEFHVNTYTTGKQSHQEIGVDEKGNFVVVWHSPGDDGFYDVVGRRVDVFGPEGSEFRVNSYTTNFQALPAIATSRDGDFIVVWEGSFQE